jgi:hypothetical protein
MFGKLLKSVSWQVRAELRRSLKSNRDYKKLRWNPVERILIACTTHYIRAMLVLWSAAFAAVGVVEYFRLYYYLSLCSISRVLPRFQVGCLIYWVAS